MIMVTWHGLQFAWTYLQSSGSRWMRQQWIAHHKRNRTITSPSAGCNLSTWTSLRPVFVARMVPLKALLDKRKDGWEVSCSTSIPFALHLSSMAPFAIYFQSTYIARVPHTYRQRSSEHYQHPTHSETEPLDPVQLVR